MSRALFSCAAVTVLATAGLVLGGGTAAATVTDYQTNGARIRASADGGASVIGLGYTGQGATTHCGRPAPGVYWIFHTNRATGVTGWTAGSNIAGVIHNLPRC